MKKEKKKYSSLEWEVIYAVVILYLLISGTILAIHYWHSNTQEEIISSSVPLATHCHKDHMIS